MEKVAFMLLISLKGESLNNKETIGNTTMPRDIEINGKTRNAISGEMLKHFHQKNLRELAEDDELCDTCKILSPMKNGKVKNFDPKFSSSGNRVKECIIDDIEGFMNAGKSSSDGKRNEKRTSCIHFSWGISTDNGDYHSNLHTRVDPSQKNEAKKTESKNEDGEIDTTSDANTNSSQNTQMIYYRPIRSNTYAITVKIDLDRIGFDDEKLIYTLPKDTLKRRKIMCLLAIKTMFLNMDGALCSTHLPHLGNIKGIVVIKNSKRDILVEYSAINKDFIDVNKKLSNDNITFDNILEFSDCIDKLIKKIKEGD